MSENNSSENFDVSAKKIKRRPIKKTIENTKGKKHITKNYNTMDKPNKSNKTASKNENINNI